ncbi:UNVERIFIED_CONTAM: hypothetical protein FKN15_017682 [Acipenser sinensis]
MWEGGGSMTEGGSEEGAHNDSFLPDVRRRPNMDTVSMELSRTAPDASLLVDSVHASMT